jgi:L-amino acid N-acyltransferase
VLIRDALEADLPGIAAIRNDVVATSTAIFSEEPSTLDELRTWWQGRVAQGYPVLVAAEDDDVLGYGSFGDFRTWPGYRFTAEHSVHVRADARRRGIGRALLQELVEQARAQGKHVLVGGIDADNDASIHLHEQLGFVRVAHMPEVGFKWGRRLDLVLMQIVLD